MGSTQSHTTQERVVSVERSEDGATEIVVTEDFVHYLKRKAGEGTDPKESSQERSHDQGSRDQGEPVDVDDIYTPDDAETIVAPLRGEFQGTKGYNNETKWKRKYEMEKMKNEQIKELTSEEFGKMVDEVKEKLSNQVAQLVPVCEDYKDKVLNCYHSNTGRPLNCYNEVQEYIQCVRRMQGDETIKTQTEELPS